MPRTMTEEERQRIYNLGRASIPCTNGWRPIETAPKDGRHILVYSNDRIISAYWSFSAEDWADVLYGDIMQLPPHWQPLPKPPPE